MTTSTAASSYSTGGGGVVLEHRYAATLLARLLVGAPCGEIGDNIELTKVRLQASDVSAVDDIVLEGTAPDGALHRASIGVRRDPALNSSDTASVPLIRAFLAVVTEHWDEVSAGRWPLVLAVAGSRQAFGQVATLSVIARSVSNAAAFDAAVNRPGATNSPTRRRLAHLMDLVVAAAAEDTDLAGFDVDELVWRLLSSLSVRTLRLEGTDTSDRSSAVAVLQGAVVDGTSATAETVLHSLAELVDEYAPSGAQVTGAMLRRRLATYPLKRFRPHERAWAIFERLDDLLHQQAQATISAGKHSVHIQRDEAVEALRRSMAVCADSGGPLVVTGEPDVGKSALSVAVGDLLRADGSFVACMSLRDVRGSVLEFEGQLGGVTLTDLFAGAPTATVRLLVVDGCEAVLEGQESLFTELAASAMKQSIGVVAVTRYDGAKFVEAALQRVAAAVDPSQQVQTHVVQEFTQAERALLAERIPGLVRVHEDAKSNWLLGRPGLVDALLRSGRPIEPDQLLCEADVYVAVWNGLVLRDGTYRPGFSPPEEREGAALAVARRRLGAQETTPTSAAVRELRSDGVFRADANPALSQGPDFSTDLYRDFALCRLFLSVGWTPLIENAAPRWTIRAVRLACEARLTNPGDRTRRQVWDELAEEFNAIAAGEGVRWREVPVEALLTVGDGREAIGELWDVLQRGEGLDALLRLASSRYVGVFGDRFALAPIVEVAFCEGRDLGRPRAGTGDTQQERVQELVLAWLSGMAHAGAGPDPLRQRVRETILGQDRPLCDEFAIQALAALGEDLNDAAANWLRKVARERPSSLEEIPESPSSVLALARVDPDLLLELTEAYYIEQPEPENDELGWAGLRGRRPLDDGIRDFRHGNKFGFGPPSAAWYFGPFFRLLNERPLETIAFINRMLDQAAFYRVTDETQILTAGVDWSSYPGASLHLTAKSGPRHYAGDAHVWSWYRGTSVGPYSCMSALLALERFIDHLHNDAEIPLATIVDLLLEDCHNLAIPGLVYGFLTRHLDQVGDLLDPFLADVVVWHLEIGRVTTEGAFTVRDRDADMLAGQDRRRYSPHETVGWMVVNARASGNQGRLDQLAAVGSRLLESAQRNVDAEQAASEPDRAEEALTREGPEQYLAMIGSWAAEFSAENYEASVVDGGVVVQFERPAELEAVLAPGNAQISATQAFMRLRVAYALKNETPEAWPVDSIAADFAEARQLMDESSSAMLDWHENPVVAVAAAGLRAHALGLATLKLTDLDWAVDLVLTAAEEPWIDGFSTSSSLFSMGSDRAAAIAVPLLLLPVFENLDVDAARLQRALTSLATSVYDEVRTAFAKGTAPVWAANCAASEGTVCTRHEPLWKAIQACLSTVRLGPWDYETQRRQSKPLEGPFEQTLPTVSGDELLVNRLRMPVVCNHAALSTQCTAARAELLASALWDAHLRALDHAWRGGYDHLGERHHELVARLFIQLAAEGDREALDAHLRLFASNAHALHSLLHGFATAFSYDEQLRTLLTEFWPPVLATVLDEIDAGASLIDDSTSWRDYAISALLPVPQIKSEDLDPDATLSSCRASWASPEAFGGVIDRWLAIGKGEPKCADAVAQFARTAPTNWQATDGLVWLESVLDGRFGALANRTWFVTKWLGELRASAAVVGPPLARYRRIVDGLAAAGDSASVVLQQLEES
ncbi:MAG: hypothetical protein KJ938_04480 [Actinobacteria bacterium]|nr:hypothetical protein [Actinomycetota bacterium]